MRSARAVGVGLLLSFLLWPEIPRYRAERQLGRASAAFEYVLDRPTEIKGAPAILDRITDAAIAAASDLPGDSRAWALAGSCQLVNRNADRALDLYREALAMYAKTLPPNHLNVAITRIKLGRVLLRENRFKDAEGETLAGYDILSKQASPLEDVSQAGRLRVKIAICGLNCDVSSSEPA